MGAYVDLNLKEQRCWGVEGGLPRKILNWAEGQRPKSNQNHRHRQAVRPVLYSAKASFFDTAAQIWFCEIIQMISVFLGLSCLDREGDVDSNYSPTNINEIFSINQSLEASVHRRASRKRFKTNHWPLVAIWYTDIMETCGPSHLMAPNMHSLFQSSYQQVAIPVAQSEIISSWS